MRQQEPANIVDAGQVAANSPLQSYFVDPGFAAVAASWMFGERMAHRLADGQGRP